MDVTFRHSDDPLRPLLTGGGPVLVVGLGHSGISAANLLAGMGCRVHVSERSRREEGKVDISGLDPSVQVHWGGHPGDLFARFPLVVVSPGVPKELEALHDTREAGGVVIGEVELAYRLTTVPWVGVTGSNGKSTTVTLVDLMAREQGLKVATGANLGTPATSFVGGDAERDFILAEISSFQLETVDYFRPAVAALLNISPDHLDRHPDMEDYVASKQTLFRRMEAGDWSVLNVDDDWVRRVTAQLHTSRFPFSRREILEEGAFVREGFLVMREEGQETTVTSVRSLALPGSHNLENALAAVAVASRMGVGAPAMAKILKSFRGLEHRMELLGYFRGVPVYNDSKGTNVGATVRSLEGMGSDVILILGGKDKGASYEPLVNAARSRVSHLILLGEAAGRMEEAFQGAADIVRVDSLDEAVRLAVQRARPGSEILFSPACSSFDMFSGFEERGRAFKKAAAKYMGLVS